MKVVILGPGAVGGFLAALFWKNNIPVQCIAKKETAELINKNGIQIQSKTFGNFTAYPKARERLSVPADIIFITVKANFIEDAVDRLDPKLTQNSLIIPLLNGLAHIEVLRSRYGKNVIAGTISALEVLRGEPGIINHVSKGAKIEIASDDSETKKRLHAAAELIRQIGLAAEILEKEAEVIWRKLVRLNAIACATAATGKTIGVLRSDPVWRKKIGGAVREAVAVAAKEGVVMNTEEVIAQIDKVEAGQLSSLARDVSKGRPSEVDAIPGAILKKCAVYGFSCPAVSELYQLIKAREKKVTTGF